MSASIISLNKKLLQVILVSTASVFLITGCGESGSGSVNTAPIMINADSGTQRSFEGTWRGCGTDMTTWFDLILDYTITGNQMVVVGTPLDSNDNSCSGIATAGARQFPTITLVSDQDVTTLGWSDGAAPTAPPTNLAMTGTLQDPPVASGVIWNYTDGGTAYSDKFLMYIDDSVTQWCVYFHVNPSSHGGVDANGYSKYLLDNTSVCKN